MSNCFFAFGSVVLFELQIIAVRGCTRSTQFLLTKQASHFHCKNSIPPLHTPPQAQQQQDPPQDLSQHDLVERQLVAPSLRRGQPYLSRSLRRGGLFVLLSFFCLEHSISGSCLCLCLEHPFTLALLMFAWQSANILNG